MGNAWSKSAVQPVPLPEGSLAARAFPRIDYADAFRVRVPREPPESVDALCRALFSDAPAWVILLMRLRNALVRPFGLRTTVPPASLPHPDGVLRPGDRVGIFRVFERAPAEVLLGDDDRHLDFRVSVRMESGDAACWVVVSTVVRFHGWLGRAYFLPVRPFHRAIVPALLRRGIRNAARGKT